MRLPQTVTPETLKALSRMTAPGIKCDTRGSEALDIRDCNR